MVNVSVALEELRNQLNLPLELVLKEDYQAFLRNARDNLDDAATFLIWADWLDEWANDNNDNFAARIKAITLRFPAAHEELDPLRDAISGRFPELKNLDPKKLIRTTNLTRLGTTPGKVTRITAHRYRRAEAKPYYLYLRLLSRLRKFPIRDAAVGKRLAANPYEKYERSGILERRYSSTQYVKEIIHTGKIGVLFHKFVQRELNAAFDDGLDFDYRATVRAPYYIEMPYPCPAPELTAQALLNKFVIEMTDNWIEAMRHPLFRNPNAN